jgi:molybdopterin molybdotransferase
VRTPDEALAEILRRLVPRDRAEEAPLEHAAGRVLARDVASDVDVPPFEKSAMDGFAVRSADFARRGGAVRLRRIGESRAGAPFAGAVGAGECAEITTGAELPAGCDAVVMVEKSAAAGERIDLDDDPRPGQNVCHRGEDLRAGDLVLSRGRRLAALDLGALAAVGCEPVPVVARPRVAVLATGDELVPPARRPGHGQIREGNSIHLSARARLAGAEVRNLGIIEDEEAALERAFRSAFEACDAVITTGGVSMGRYDLVGTVLARCGVEPVFHKVAMKPGKPCGSGCAATCRSSRCPATRSPASSASRSSCARRSPSSRERRSPVPAVRSRAGAGAAPRRARTPASSTCPSASGRGRTA